MDAPRDDAGRFALLVRTECVSLGIELGALLERELGEVAAMLIEKNAAYGNSALDPVRVFSKADVAEQIRVRMDDKISRIVRGHAAGEDVERDLIGYFVILRVSRQWVTSEDFGGAPTARGGTS